ncbi:hypothetical protein BKA61DRAFT_684655 [Leptodontidium sp. MPI-SDFR-AT-0119]|nr:hypothetical protein BKA61DRAFT_684655 [Leptodontidium sp. MPI-SDFR-AT-0119]
MEETSDKLLEEDWDTLKIYSAFLENLNHTIKALELTSSTLDNVLLVIDYIMELFEEGKE